MPNKKDFSLTVFVCVESRKSCLAEGESKNEDAISPGNSTKDGTSSRDGKPDQSESANGAEAQLEGSRADCITTDPYKGPGAIPKRPKQGSSLKAETSSSKDTWAEETVESKDDDFSNDKKLPYAVQGKPDNNVDLFYKTHGKTNMNHCWGLVFGSHGL